MSDCIFCKIAGGDIPSATLYEDDDFRVILDLGPATKGHALILPKHHYANLYEIPEEMAAKAAEENYDLLFFDELIYTIRAGLFDEQILLDYLKNEKPAHLEVILTGQQPSEELVALADYVSEIRKIKHPFDHGLPARLGIEK